MEIRATTIQKCLISSFVSLGWLFFEEGKSKKALFKSETTLQKSRLKYGNNTKRNLFFQQKLRFERAKGTKLRFERAKGAKLRYKQQNLQNRALNDCDVQNYTLLAPDDASCSTFASKTALNYFGDSHIQRKSTCRIFLQLST